MRTLFAALLLVASASALSAQLVQNTEELVAQVTMKVDLMNLATVQEAFWAENRRYASLSELGYQYRASRGVVVRITAATARGWAGEATYTGAISICRIQVGLSSKNEPYVNAGEPTCYLLRS